MIRNRNRCSAFINGTTSVVARKDPFDDNRPTPTVANPTQVCPRHSGARECGIDIDERHPPLAGSPSGSHFAARVHDTAVSHGGKQEGKGKVEAQNAGTQIAIRNRDRMAGPECHVFKGATILAKRNLAFGAAVQIVKNGFRHSSTRQRPEILDANNPGGCYFAGRSSHPSRVPCVGKISTRCNRTWSASHLCCSPRRA